MGGGDAACFGLVALAAALAGAVGYLVRWFTEPHDDEPHDHPPAPPTTLQPS